MQLTGATLDNIKDHLNATIDNLSENHSLVVNKTLPDLTGLSVNFFDGVVLENEHTAEDSLFGFLINIGGCCLKNIILKFFDELEHKD